jgi:parafibromin
MASTEQDPLFLLRQSIASGQHAVPIAGDDATSAECSLSQASHLRFPHAGDSTMALDSATRFQSNDSFVNLRSIYFAWLNREVAIPEYNASASKLNEELATRGRVQNLAFVERLDLITWLEGASEESEYIKPLAGERDGDGTGAASAGAGKGAAASTAVGRSGRGNMDPRLAAIYGGERRMGDRNSVLRGIKPTVSILLTFHLPSGLVSSLVRNF